MTRFIDGKITKTRFENKLKHNIKGKRERNKKRMEEVKNKKAFKNRAENKI